MSVATEISRIQTARNTIRSKAVELGIGTSTDDLTKLATEIDGIENRGAVSATVQEGDTYTVTATAADVLTGKVFVDKAGKTTTGTMPNNGAATETLTPEKLSYTIPKGYHSGTGKVQITPETKSVTPNKSVQTVEPTDGKVLTSVEVAAIPEAYVDTSDGTAVAGDILNGKTAYAKGAKVTGSMANNGAVSGEIDGLTTTSFAVPAGYTTGGSVSLTGDIEEALAAI